MREAHDQDLRRHGSRSLPEAFSFVHGKPDSAGGPILKQTLTSPEARPCGRPYCIQPGSRTMREAHSQDLRRHGRQYRPNLILCYGRPDTAGGPMIKYTLKSTEAGLCRKPYCIEVGSGGRAGVYAGCQAERLFFAPSQCDHKSRYFPSYLHGTEQPLAGLHRVLPQRPLYIEHNHVGCEPLLIADREFLHILVPFVRRDD